MGMFDQFIGEITKAAGAPGAESANLLGGVMDMLNQSPGGGLGELVQGFEKAGLGHIAQSWISTGPNLAATPQQAAEGFGMDRVSALAKQFGLSPQMVSMALAALLPVLIDKLSPKGELPKATAGGGLASIVTGALGQMGGLGGLLGSLGGSPRRS